MVAGLDHTIPPGRTPGIAHPPAAGTYEPGSFANWSRHPDGQRSGRSRETGSVGPVECRRRFEELRSGQSVAEPSFSLDAARCW